MTNTNEIAEKLIYVWRDAVSDKPAETVSHWFFAQKGIHIALTSEGARAFDALVGLLLDDPQIKAKFSPNYLEDRVKDAVVQLIDVAQKEIVPKAREHAQSLLALSSQPAIEWTVLVAIQNLNLQVDALEIGNVTIRSGKQQIQDALMILPENLRERVSRSNGDIESLMNAWERIPQAGVTVSAVDSHRASELAKQAIESALDLLRVFSFVNQRQLLDLANSIRLGENTLLFSNRGGFASTTLRLVEFPEGFSVTNELLNEWRKWRFQAASQVLKKQFDPDLSELEKAVIRFISFFGTGMKDLTPSGAFINVIIALESLLLREYEGKETLAERVAFVTADDADTRWQMYSEVKKFYAMRSQMVHGGRIDITKSNVFSVSYLAFVVLHSLLGRINEWKSVADIVEWVRAKKFS